MFYLSRLENLKKTLNIFQLDQCLRHEASQSISLRQVNGSMELQTGPTEALQTDLNSDLFPGRTRRANRALACSKQPLVRYVTATDVGVMSAMEVHLQGGSPWAAHPSVEACFLIVYRWSLWSRGCIRSQKGCLEALGPGGTCFMQYNPVSGATQKKSSEARRTANARQITGRDGSGHLPRQDQYIPDGNDI